MNRPRTGTHASSDSALKMRTGTSRPREIGEKRLSAFGASPLFQQAAKHSSRRGLIAIVVMVMLLVSMLILLAVVRAATLDARQFVMERRAMQADRLAEAGLARGLLSLSEETYDGEEWQPALPDGTTASVRISIEETDDTRRLLAVATWPAGSDRAVRSRRSTLLSQSTP